MESEKQYNFSEFCVADKILYRLLVNFKIDKQHQI